MYTVILKNADSTVLTFQNADNLPASFVQYWDDNNADFLARPLLDALFKGAVALARKPGNDSFFTVSPQANDGSFTVSSRFCCSFLVALRTQTFAYCRKYTGVVVYQNANAPASVRKNSVVNVSAEKKDLFQTKRTGNGATGKTQAEKDLATVRALIASSPALASTLAETLKQAEKAVTDEKARKEADEKARKENKEALKKAEKELATVRALIASSPALASTLAETLKQAEKAVSALKK